MKGKKVLTAIITIVLFLLANASSWVLAADDPMPGAIWTTDKFGNVVNGNVIYSVKEDVYLNGGPNKDGTKLPEGDYYIQVTEPGGKVLGTSVGGKNGPETYYVDSKGNFIAGPIQLYAATKFRDTSNSGDEYKVWISKDNKFSLSSSKTDNFKVRKKGIPCSTLEIQKFNDFTNDGIKQADEPYVRWNVTITNTATGISNTVQLNGYDGTASTTGTDGIWKGYVEPGTYTVTENTGVYGWVPTTATSFTVTLADKGSAAVVFGNRKLHGLEITKFYDSNVNGRKDSEEQLLNWKVRLEWTESGQVLSRDILLVNGSWSGLMEPGEYTVSEYMPDSGWICTTEQKYTVTLEPDKTSDIALKPAKQIAFGNVCVGTGGGHTHGFWGNINGEAIFKTQGGEYLSAINSLPLVDENGKRVTPFPGDIDAAYEAYALWNQDANAINMAYMLSCQLAAMKLNVTAGTALGFVDGNGFILVGTNEPIYAGTANVNYNGFIAVKDLIAAAGQAIEEAPYTVEASAARSYQELLKNLLDKANNDNAIYIKTTPQQSPYAFS